MNYFPALAIVNKCTVLAESTIKTAIPAFQHQITYDFKPHWGVGAKVLYIAKGQSIPPNCWQIWIEDDSDVQGALGYHEVTDEGLPLSRVFAKTDIKYGLNWTVTATHEILEMLADPWANTAWQTDRYTFHALEVGDPVEADHYAYKGYNDVYVTDFILPYWFQPQFAKLKNAKFDFKGYLKAPLQLLPGGYVSYYDVRTQKWNQKQMQYIGTDKEPKMVDVDVRTPAFKKDWRRPRISAEVRQENAYPEGEKT